mgnify:CR=1 FL=1
MTRQTEEESTSAVDLLRTKLDEVTSRNEELLIAVDQFKIEEARFERNTFDGVSWMHQAVWNDHGSGE